MRNLVYCLGLTCCLIVSPGAAQEPPGAKSLAATLEVYAFPKEGQTTEQQSKDEAACYDWAVSNTGNDPFELEKESEQEQAHAAEQTEAVKQSTQGAGARGAVRGAAAGAIIDDSSEGAAVGAAVGVIASRRRARHHSEEAQEQIEQQSATQESATAEEIGNFKKAFSACLEAKDYLVKI